MLERENVVRILSETQTQTTETDVPNCNSQIFSGPRSRASLNDLKDVFLDIYQSHKTFFCVVLNISLVLLVTIVLTKEVSPDCLPPDDDVFVADASVFCDPYYPLDRVIVDVDLNTSAHCYSSKSCVALGQSLRQQQGRFRYNFIIGAYGFTYMQHGYTCQSEALEDALYIRLPVDSIYNGQDFMAARRAVGKLTEILREGLECGRLWRNYTLTAKGCGRHDDWCSKSLYELVAEDPTDRGASGPRISYYDRVQPGAFYNPLNLNRVYSYQYKLVVCMKAPGK